MGPKGLSSCGKFELAIDVYFNALQSGSCITGMEYRQWNFLRFCVPSFETQIHSTLSDFIASDIEITVTKICIWFTLFLDVIEQYTAASTRYHYIWMVVLYFFSQSFDICGRIGGLRKALRILCHPQVSRHIRSKTIKGVVLPSAFLVLFSHGTVCKTSLSHENPSLCPWDIEWMKPADVSQRLPAHHWLLGIFILYT